MKRTPWIWMLWAMSLGAHAAPIYRCGAEGHRVYSEVPCPEGRLIDAADPRSAAQRAEAQRVAARERRAAAQLERDRLEADQTAPAEAGGFKTSSSIGASRPSAAPSTKRKHAHAKKIPAGTDFVAVEPGGSKKPQAQPRSN